MILMWKSWIRRIFLRPPTVLPPMSVPNLAEIDLFWRVFIRVREASNFRLFLCMSILVRFYQKLEVFLEFFWNSLEKYVFLRRFSLNSKKNPKKTRVFKENHQNWHIQGSSSWGLGVNFGGVFTKNSRFFWIFFGI